MVKTFLFNLAQYRVGDENGNIVLLKIDYWNKSYDLETLKNGKASASSLRNEAKKIAEDLLSRKHRVNFVDRVVKLRTSA